LIADVTPALVEDRFRAFPVSLIDEEEPVAGFPDVKFRELFPMLIEVAFGFAGLGEVVIIVVFGVVMILGVVVSVSVSAGVVVISVGAVVATGIGVIVVVAGIGVVVAAAGGGGVVVVVIVGIGEIIGVIGGDDDIVVVVVGGVFVPDDDRALFVLRDDGPGDSLTALVDVPTPFTLFEDV